ncbi:MULTISPECIES: hypothetical protein [Calothrix]|uniref:Uncharacterized protein n=2 Tax=Calothrix TaxID=1186 RepID=A0ABR8AIY7_9CYAN|nr:hypothetical protein [Calothrix parietina]MBD2199729.1 hypothetical protein [Calothrix parietina FACHB-288]MBD2228526.1 hypothetical protein [Calothrix anomala FACHB-343]
MAVSNPQLKVEWLSGESQQALADQTKFLTELRYWQELKTYPGMRSQFQALELGD